MIMMMGWSATIHRKREATRWAAARPILSGQQALDYGSYGRVGIEVLRAWVDHILCVVGKPWHAASLKTSS